MEIKRVLVTGSDGYIGTVLVRELIKHGYEVLGLDTSFYKDITLGKYKPNYRLLIDDIRNIDNLSLKNIDAIIHLAALSSDSVGEFNPKVTEAINYLATIRLATKAKRIGVKRFIFSSSCGIYGISSQREMSEKSKVMPLTTYAKSKIMAENAIQKLASKNFCIVNLRLSTVYGYSPKFRNDVVVNNFVTCAIGSGYITVLSDGTPWRPQIDVRDLAKIFIEFLKIDAEKINGEVFNIGFNENNFQVKDILVQIQQLLPDCKVVYTGKHDKDTRSYRVNFDKLHKLFPLIKQEWPLSRSINDLITRLKQVGFSKDDFISGKYTRLGVIKKLVTSSRLTRKLYWKK